MSDVRECKAALARLAEDDVVARASTAVRDLETAVRFREAVGLDALERAVGRATDERAVRGRVALRVFEDYVAAASGEHFTAASGEHFQSGHDSPLGDGTKADAK